MAEIIDWERIARYVARESSPSERAEVERWLAADRSRRELLAHVQRDWSMTAQTVELNVEQAWSRVSARMQDGSVRDVSPDVVLDELDGAQKRFSVRRFALPIAAGFVLAIGVAYWQFSDDARSAVLAGAGNEYVVPRGASQRTVTLGDSTEVILASASRLVVAADYGNGSRSVDLEGEALFRVRHDATRPFRVRAGAVIAEDLGTEFVVRHVAQSGADVRIAVSEGVVALRRSAAPNAGDTLRARDVAIASDSAVLVRRDQDLDAYFAWTRGQLVFDKTPLSEVAAELSRWFDLDIDVDSSVASRTYSAAILTSTPIDEILQIVGSSADVKVERNGRSVRFTRPGFTGQLSRPSRSASAREVAG